MRNICPSTVASLLLWMIAMGCGKSGKFSHPDHSQFPKVNEINHRLDIRNPSVVYRNTFSYLLESTPITVIGKDSIFSRKLSFDGIPPKMDIDLTGHIYIVQNHGNTINVYDKYGSYLYEIGRAGRGPGEFFRIHSFVFDKEYESLYVLDYNKVEVFTRNNLKFEYHKTILLDIIRTTDICIIDSYLYISGHRIIRDDVESVSKGIKKQGEARSTAPILRLDLTNQNPSFSFGYSYNSESGWGFLNSRMSETLISCNYETKTVVGYPSHFPYIFGYDTDGNQKWISKIDGYISTEFTEEMTSEGPSFYSYTNSDILHHKLPTPRTDIGTFSVLQFVNRLPQDFFAKKKNLTLNNNSINTILVDTNSGELTYTHDFARIGVLKSNIAITFVSPYPQPTLIMVHEN